MSRLGKIAVSIPKGAKISVNNAQALVEGPKGKLTLSIPSGISVEQKEDKLFVHRSNDEKQIKAHHGTVRSHLANMVLGVTQGYKRNLEIQGVGFRAQAQGQKLSLNLGFSHPVDYNVPAGVIVKTPKPTEIEIEGIDKALVGEVAAKIREIKPPEPYKGKGIRYSGEAVRRKQGKKVTK
ncbi:MAG: 50S ribosomal protein L6 [Candidatus Omnitrophota bacterium]